MSWRRNGMPVMSPTAGVSVGPCQRRSRPDQSQCNRTPYNNRRASSTSPALEHTRNRLRHTSIVVALRSRFIATPHTDSPARRTRGKRRVAQLYTRALGGPWRTLLTEPLTCVDRASAEREDVDHERSEQRKADPQSDSTQAFTHRVSIGCHRFPAPRQERANEGPRRIYPVR